MEVIYNGISPPALAVAGMAGLVGGSTGAALAAIVMIFEMTLDYSVILPMTVTVALSYGIRKYLSRESVYTLKLVRRGHSIPDAFQADVMSIRKARDLMEGVKIVKSSDTIDLVSDLFQNEEVFSFLVADSDAIIGLVPKNIALKMGKDTKFSDTAIKDYVLVKQTDTLLDIISKINKSAASLALVTDDTETGAVNKVKGVITKGRLVSALKEYADLFSE